jgi:hypothetical protein
LLRSLKLAQRGSRLSARLLRRRSGTKSVSPPSSSARRVARSVFDCLARQARSARVRFVSLRLARRAILHVEIPLELVDVAGGLHVVLRDCDGAVARLVDVNNKG